MRDKIGVVAVAVQVPRLSSLTENATRFLSTCDVVKAASSKLHSIYHRGIVVKGITDWVAQMTAVA